jgi:hypothetical protein
MPLGPELSEDRPMAVGDMRSRVSQWLRFETDSGHAALTTVALVHPLGPSLCHRASTHGRSRLLPPPLILLPTRMIGGRQCRKTQPSRPKPGRSSIAIHPCVLHPASGALRAVPVLDRWRLDWQRVCPSARHPSRVVEVSPCFDSSPFRTRGEHAREIRLSGRIDHDHSHRVVLAPVPSVNQRKNVRAPVPLCL